MVYYDNISKKTILYEKIDIDVNSTNKLQNFINKDEYDSVDSDKSNYEIYNYNPKYNSKSFIQVLKKIFCL